MKKYATYILLLVALFTACKKSKNPTYTSMTLFVNNDSAWTITDVTSKPQDDGSLLITGHNTPKGETVTFTLAGYREGRKTYYIGSGSIPGYSYGSSATYDYSGYLAKGTGGQVAITNQTTHIIEGTFDVVTDRVHITGRFGAPIPD